MDYLHAFCLGVWAVTLTFAVLDLGWLLYRHGWGPQARDLSRGRGMAWRDLRQARRYRTLLLDVEGMP